jgi:hypothetical protein
MEVSSSSALELTRSISPTRLLGVFGALIVMDEIFHEYRVEGDHRGISVLLVSLMALQLLPEREG